MISNMKQIELDTPVEEMDEESLRATLSDVMDAHEANYAEAAEREAEFSETEEKLTAAEEQLGAAKSAFAAKAAPHTNIDADVLVERFSMDELVAYAEEAEAAGASFAEETPEPEASDDPEDDPEATFAEKPPKAPSVADDEMDYSEQAAARLTRFSGLVLE